MPRGLRRHVAVCGARSSGCGGRGGSRRQRVGLAPRIADGPPESRALSSERVLGCARQLLWMPSTVYDDGDH